jgi:hypothetical protein
MLDWLAAQFYWTQDGSSGATRLIVANLTRNVTEDHLHEIFGTYGSLTKVERMCTVRSRACWLQLQGCKYISLVAACANPGGASSGQKRQPPARLCTCRVQEP